MNCEHHGDNDVFLDYMTDLSCEFKKYFKNDKRQNTVGKQNPNYMHNALSTLTVI